MMGKLSNEDKMHIQTFYQQRFGTIVIIASYYDKNWSLSTDVADNFPSCRWDVSAACDASCR